MRRLSPTGRFVIVDGFEVAGGGIVAADNYPRRTPDSLQKSHNIYLEPGQSDHPTSAPCATAIAAASSG